MSEKYKSAMDKITASDELKARIIKAAEEKTKPASKKIFYIRYAAGLAACIAIAITGYGIFKKPNTITPDVITPPVAVAKPDETPDDPKPDSQKPPVSENLPEKILPKKQPNRRQNLRRQSRPSNLIRRQPKFPPTSKKTPRQAAWLPLETERPTVQTLTK